MVVKGPFTDTSTVQPVTIDPTTIRSVLYFTAMMSHGVSYERVMVVLGLVLVAVSCVAQSRKIDCT